jgi:branched-subunit amino acid aminotransferase/4-amino-4-deoxychorismate lyase
MSKASGDFAPWLGAFETLRVVNGVPLFMAEHRAELQRATEALGLKMEFDFEQAAMRLPARSGRWRWIVTPEETRTLFSEEEGAAPEPLAVSISPVRVGSCNWDARFKTLSYLSHVQAWKTASTPEVVLLNEHGHVASASRANIFWRRGDRVFTPAHEVGCRCGVVRTFILKRHAVETGHFPLSDLLEAEEIFLSNSLKGIVSIYEIKGRPVPSSASAAGLRCAYDEAVAEQLGTK